MRIFPTQKKKKQNQYSHKMYNFRTIKHELHPKNSEKKPVIMVELIELAVNLNQFYH